MTAPTTSETAPKVVRPSTTSTRRPRNTAPLASGSSREAKRLAAVILEVFAGVRTLPQAAEALEMSLTRFYYLEARAMRGLLEACEPRRRGPQVNPERELAAIRRENERLRQDLGRQQSLVRIAQRTIGLNPPPPPKPAPKTSGKKSRKRKPVVRALSLATRLQQETTAPEPASDNGSSPPVNA